MSAFVIRSASGAEDREFIRTLDDRLIDVIVAPAHSRAEVAAFQARFTATAFDESEDAGATFVACDADGRRLGYVNVRPGMDDIPDEPCAYIALLAVVEEQERTGVARALVEHAESWAAQKGYERIALDVFASNAGARAFYESAGYGAETLRMVRQI